MNTHVTRHLSRITAVAALALAATTAAARTVSIASVSNGSASLASSELAALRVESGTLVVTDEVGMRLSAASVEVAEGATRVLDGVTLRAGNLSEHGTVERRNGGDIEVAAPRFTWFSAGAATSVVSGGAWVSGDAAFGRVAGLARPEAVPPVVDGVWQITDAMRLVRGGGWASLADPAWPGAHCTTECLYLHVTDSKPAAVA